MVVELLLVGLTLGKQAVQIRSVLGGSAVASGPAQGTEPPTTVPSIPASPTIGITTTRLSQDLPSGRLGAAQVRDPAPAKGHRQHGRRSTAITAMVGLTAESVVTPRSPAPEVAARMSQSSAVARRRPAVDPSGAQCRRDPVQKVLPDGTAIARPPLGEIGLGCRDVGIPAVPE